MDTLLKHHDIKMYNILLESHDKKMSFVKTAIDTFVKIKYQMLLLIADFPIKKAFHILINNTIINRIDNYKLMINEADFQWDIIDKDVELPELVKEISNIKYVLPNQIIKDLQKKIEHIKMPKYKFKFK